VNIFYSVLRVFHWKLIFTASHQLNLLTNRDPMYITNTGLHPAIFHIIEKCCAVDKGKRYQTIPELKQGISLAYDVILNRASGGGRARQMLAQILDKIHTANQYNSAEIKEFVDLLASLPFDEQYAIIYDLPREFFIVMSLNPMSDVLGLFLDCYDPFVQPAVHTFSYAEVVANNMKEVFQRASGPAQRAKALELAVHAAIWANRFAAMDTCRDMVMSVEANDLGLPVATLVSQNKDSFLGPSGALSRPRMTLHNGHICQDKSAGTIDNRIKEGSSGPWRGFRERPWFSAPLKSSP